MGDPESVMTVNVGGKIFMTTITTLRSDDQSKLYDIFSSKNLKLLLKDQEGNPFLDLNPSHFEFVLDYLRIVKNLKNKKGAFRPSRNTNEVKGNFRMYGKDYEVRDIWLGDQAQSCTADELLEHVLPTTTEHLYGTLMQAEYFGLHHLKSILAMRLQRGNTMSFLMEDMLDALGKEGKDGDQPNGDAKARRRSVQIDD